MTLLHPEYLKMASLSMPVPWLSWSKRLSIEHKILFKPQQCLGQYVTELPMCTVVKNPLASAADARDTGLILCWEIPWSRKCQPHFPEHAF